MAQVDSESDLQLLSDHLAPKLKAAANEEAGCGCSGILVLLFFIGLALSGYFSWAATIILLLCLAVSGAILGLGREYFPGSWQVMLGIALLAFPLGVLFQASSAVAPLDPPSVPSDLEDEISSLPTAENGFVPKDSPASMLLYPDPDGQTRLLVQFPGEFGSVNGYWTYQNASVTANNTRIPLANRPRNWGDDILIGQGDPTEPFLPELEFELDIGTQQAYTWLPITVNMELIYPDYRFPYFQEEQIAITRDFSLLVMPMPASSTQALNEKMFLMINDFPGVGGLITIACIGFVIIVWGGWKYVRNRHSYARRMSLRKLGINVINLGAMNLPSEISIRQGYFVDAVSSSLPAVKEAIMKKDIIIEWDDKPINDNKSLNDFINTLKTGQTLQIRLIRDNIDTRVQITI